MIPIRFDDPAYLDEETQEIWDKLGVDLLTNNPNAIILFSTPKEPLL